MDAAVLMHVLRRRFPALLACIAAGLGGALLLNHRSEPVYQSTALVFVNIPTTGSVQSSVQGVLLTSDLLPSYAQIASSRSVVGRVREQLGLSEGVDRLRSNISAKALPQKLILEIDVKDHDPYRAQSLANATTQALADTVRDLEKARAPETAVQLQVVDAAVVGRKIAPRTKYNVALGLLLGGSSGLALALLLETLDRTIKTNVQAEQATHGPVLGLIPRWTRRDGPIAVLGDGPTAETYRALRTAIKFADPDVPPRVVMVTSPSEGEGKTTTAINLAIALAQSGERTVLVDADLRHARVAPLLGLEGAVGVTSVIMRTASLDEALQTWQDDLQVLPAGPIPRNPSEIVGSQAMARLLGDLREHADVVVIDSPPVIPVTDAVVLSTQVDGVALVVRAGKTQRAQAAEARRRIDVVQSPVLGTVLNAVKRSSAVGYYAEYSQAQNARA